MTPSQLRARSRRGPRARRLAPAVALLEGRMLLAAAPTLTTLRASIPTLTYGQTEVLTATVTTDPPGVDTPTGGTVTFNDGTTTLGTAPLVNGTATFSTTELQARLGPGSPGLTAVYSGDGAQFAGSTSASSAPFAIDTAAGGPSSALLSNPHGVAMDPAGNIVVADTGHNRIVEINHATGAVTTVAGNGTAGFSGDGGPATAAKLNAPCGVAVDPFGNIFIADTGNNRIREIDHATGVIRTFAGNGTAGFNGDSHLAIDAELNAPQGVAVDHSGHVFIADTNNNRIREATWEPGGVYVLYTVAGNGTAGYSGDDSGFATEAELNHPEGVAVPNVSAIEFTVYVADTGNNRIRSFLLHEGGVGQTITTVAGNGTAGFSGDGGPATAAELNGPSDVSSDFGARLFIADAGNNRIRTVDPITGVITTAAGDGSASFSGDNGPAAAAALNHPLGVGSSRFESAPGGFVVADTGNNAVRPGVTVPYQVTVNPAVLTVTPDDQTIVQGDPLPPLTYTITGFVNGDTAAVLKGTPVLDTTATADSPPGEYPIYVSDVRDVYGANYISSGGPPGTLTIEATPALRITGTDPRDGTWVPALPNGEVTIKFNHPLAGLTDGGPALGPDDPYAVMLIPRGPELAFAAASGIDGGTLPVHANTIYHASGTTSSITITPLEPLATDVYLIAVDPSKFKSTDGYPLTDAHDGYRTFLLQPPAPAGSPALEVTKVTERDGTVTIDNNPVPVPQPDTIAIAFNKPLYPGAANGDNVQLIANPGPNSRVVPSLAAYSPTTQSIDLTPEAPLEPGTVYEVRVDGAVSDDQGFSRPGHPLGTTFTDTFTVTDSPIVAGQVPFQVAQGQNGTPLIVPGNGEERTQPLGYVSVTFTEPLDLSPSVFSRFSARLAPWTVGSDGNQLLTNMPLNMKLAFNPNTNQLIIVPTVLTPSDHFNVWLAKMQSTTGDPLLNDAGQAAGIAGPPVVFSFRVNAGAGASPSALSTSPSALGAVVPLDERKATAESMSQSSAVPQMRIPPAWSRPRPVAQRGLNDRERPQRTERALF